MDIDLLHMWGATFHNLKKGHILFFEDDPARFITR